MRSGYKKFKHKINRAVFGKSLLVGLSVALICAGALLLLGKLNVIDDNLILALAVGGGAGLVSLIVWSIILSPGERGAARLIDRELNTKEKAQTMLAYRGVRTPMARLQREQTEKLLLKLPSAWYSVKRVWIYLTVFVLSIAFCAVAYLMPDKQTPPPPTLPEAPFELTEWQEAALEELIEYVEDSALRDAAKAAVTEELENLLAELREATLDRQMRSLVIGAITEISKIIDTTNTYDEIISELKKSEATGSAELAEAIGTPTAPMPSEKVEALRAIFSGGDIDVISNSLGELGSGVAVALGRLGVSTDPLINSLTAFSDGLFVIWDNASNYDADSVQGAVDALFDSFKLSLGIGLSEQAVNADVGIYVNERLMEIFGIQKNELPPEIEEEIEDAESGGGADGSEDEEDDEKGDSGGYGSGEVVFGSDDLIYYPDEEAYVKYGEVINEYYAKILEKIQNGEISPELAGKIMKYFESLRTAPGDDGEGD